jgi:hypothetical protein
MGLEYITRPQVFVQPITAVNGVFGINNPYPLLTTYQSWVSTGTVNTSAFPIPGTWTMLDSSGSFIVTVGNVIQSPTKYTIDRNNRRLTFSTAISAGIEVAVTQLATAAPSSQDFNYLQSVSALFINLSAVNTSIANLNVIRADVTNLTAVRANVTNLTAFNTNVTNLSVYSLTADNIISTTATIGNNTISTFDKSPLTLLGAAQGSVFLSLQNTNNTLSASTDISVYNETGNYLNLGITSAAYDGNKYDPTFNIVGSEDSYLYSTANDLAIGTSSRGTNNDILFFTGGTLSGSLVTQVSGNERMRITNSSGIYGGNIGIGTSTPNSTLTVVGDISATGNLTSRNLTVSGNLSASNIVPSRTLTVVGDVSASGNITGYNTTIYHHTTGFGAAPLTITPFFSAVGGNITLDPFRRYRLSIEAYYTKAATAGNMIFTLSSTVPFVYTTGSLIHSAILGYNTAAAPLHTAGVVTSAATLPLTVAGVGAAGATNHYGCFTYYIETSSVPAVANLFVTTAGGAINPVRGSYWQETVIG